MVINLAFAQASQASGGQNFIIQLLPLILIFKVKRDTITEVIINNNN